MASELYNTIDALSREKGIDPQIVVSAVEDAIVMATRKYYKSQENLRAQLDKETGKIHAFAVKTVVETPEQVEDPNLQVTLEDARRVDPSLEVGGELQIPKVTEGILGRIAAQLAKQVIFQKVREAERDTVYNEYISRVGVIISRVEKASKGPQVVVSRAAPELVQHLFQTEVPEIYDGTVVIRAIAREAGERTKIAVMSKDKDVDAVGACVGMKGMRVQSIIRELRGEKIDIIEYHEDPVTFAEKALQPAKVSRVTVVDATGKHLEVVVDDSQLSLAIGKKGQNVRLAAKLLGWKIDIKSEEEKRQEVEQQMQALVSPPSTPLESIPDLGEGLVAKLNEAGITSVEALADMTPEQLEAIQGIGPKTIEKITIAVTNYFGSLEAAPAEAAAATEGEVEVVAAPAAEAEVASEAAVANEAEVEVTAAPAEQAPVADASASEYQEAVETGQALEAAEIAGVESAPAADVAEVHTHAETPEAPQEDTVAPEEKPE